MLSHKLSNETLIFTDLDGTLLDHDSYSFLPALPMLEYLKEQYIPLVIVTSKTKSEVILLQKALGLKAPFIIENGAGIFIPQNGGFEMIALGKLYDETREAFSRYAKSVKIRGFSDMSIEEVALYTGLSVADAERAKERHFSEPFLIDDEAQLSQLTKMANADGFDVVKGGRFHHLITKGQDKASAIKEVIDLYKERWHDIRFDTIALGDSANDLTMLKSVDLPVLIPHKDGSYLDCYIDGMIKAPFPGPEGWNSVLKGYFHV
ncbi:MAG: HAD-IIB family hydrolase [Helicobacteraceae bacterium]|jgi:mannosyl-3-phosphoglycerate phosphatase|nr:HAD-IIB family hydrolase [Helicobacteraceae bacterium]